MKWKEAHIMIMQQTSLKGQDLERVIWLNVWSE